MTISLVGLSFKTASVEVREVVAIARSQQAAASRALCAYEGVRGAVILSTCNRTEIYVDATDPATARTSVERFIADFKHADSAFFSPHLYQCDDAEAVHHLFSVVSSLDSMVLGEQQISGQVREAFKTALQADTCTMVLARLFRQALTCGKRVRNETTISENHVSLSTVAIDVAKAEFDHFEDKTVLVVGAGEMSELAARYLRELGVNTFIVSSRTYAHALDLADELGGEAKPFQGLPSLLLSADIVISSTAAPHCVITPDMLVGCKPHLLILDIALPRDVAVECADMPGVTLYDLDDLGRIISENEEKRRVAASEARAIVEDETQQFMQWVNEHAVVPIIKRMRQDAETMREHEVDHLLRALSVDLSEDDRAAVDAATRAIVKKLLHQPTVRMKRSVADNAGYECIEAARYLYGYADDMTNRSAVLAAEAAAMGIEYPQLASGVQPYSFPHRGLPSQNDLNGVSRKNAIAAFEFFVQRLKEEEARETALREIAEAAGVEKVTFVE